MDLLSYMLSTRSDEEPEEAFDLPPLIRVYKDGRVERLCGNDVVPPSDDEPKTGIVQSKDISISPQVSARLYIPKLNQNPSSKLPILIYFHGGAFCLESSSSPLYHNYLNDLVSRAKIIAVSVNYRLVPEHPLPIAYDDSWAALQWVGSHSGRNGSDPWLNEYADFKRIFLGGDSAGANIAHHLGIRFGNNREELNGAKIEGIVLVHPYFWGKDPIGNETVDPRARDYMEKLWLLACPGTTGCDDGWINPAKDCENLAKLGCSRVLICVAEKDFLRDRDWDYYEKLGKSEWDGKIDILEAKGEFHVFHLFNPACENAGILMERIVAFVNDD